MMQISDSQVTDYERHGFVILESVFTPEEVSAMIEAVEQGPRVAEATTERHDAGGNITRLAIWHELGDDVWSAVSTSPRIVKNARLLLGEDAAFFHGKVIFKEAREGGAWEWHQDYGYWYDQGFAFPRMISAYVALDEATRENGCLQVLSGSHHLGRLDHGRIADQTGTDPERIGHIEPLFDRVHCEMPAGSVLFFHCNLLHTSAANQSENHRRAFIICYNALGNPQFREPNTFEHRACPISDDDAILARAAAR